jgi:hypothetical protein
MDAYIIVGGGGGGLPTTPHPLNTSSHKTAARRLGPKKSRYRAIKTTGTLIVNIFYCKVKAKALLY